MPGFIDTHHHLFETALRSFLADGILLPIGTPGGEHQLLPVHSATFAPVYRPQDVYINELFGSLGQLDGGVTTVHDISQIHHSPEHSDAAIKGLIDSGRRAAFGYFESAGCAFPATSIRRTRSASRSEWFSSTDQLVTMIMGGEIYLPGYERAWEDRTRARDSGRGAHPVPVRHAPDVRPARRARGRQRQLGIGPTTCSST